MTLAQQLEALCEKLRFQYQQTFHYQTCPFGPEYQEAWNHRYELFSRWNDGIKTDAIGLYSVTPEKAAQEIARTIKASSIIDAFCGIGGSAIAFAASGKQVQAIDIDTDRLNMAQHNAQIYQQNNIQFTTGDFLQLAAQLKAEAVFLDPPWGGPAYVNKAIFKLGDFSPAGDQLLEVAFQNFAQVILRVPEQFDLNELQQFHRAYKIQDNLLEGRVISKTIYFDA